MKRLLLGLVLVLTLFGTLEAKHAKAQGTTRVFASCNSATWAIQDVGRPLQLLPDGTLCVNASVSASIAGFTPNGNFATLNATAASSASTAMPAGAVVAFQNTSTIDVSCVLAAGAATATTNKIVVRGGSTIFVTVGSNLNTACINQTGVATNLVALAGGTGLGTGFGGGGAGGGGGGGAATIADGADVAEGTTTDAASTAGGVGTLSAKLRLMTTQLSTVFQTGGSIGNTTFASTQSGTWTVQPGNTANTTAWLMNVGAINGVTPLMGNGVTGTGSQRVTIASDNTAFSVNAAATLAAETTKVIGTIRNVGNAGGIFDAIGQNVAAPANWMQAGCQFNTSPTTITTGNGSPCQMDNAGNIKVNIAAGASSGAVAQGSTTSGQTGSLVQGAVTTAAPTYTTAQTNPLSLTTSGELRAFDSQLLAAAQAATPSGTNIIGKVGIDQTTPGTTNLVALAANQSMNLAQVAGVATPVGNGVQATAPRVTLATDSPGIIAPGQTTKSASSPVTIASDQGAIGSLTSQYPQGATPLTASATGTTAATTATLTGAASVTTYVCGFAIRANATAAATGTATVTGVITATMSFVQWTAPLASGIGTIEQRFNPCVPASAVNTSIAVVSAAPGAGGTVSVAAWGYRL